MSIPNTSASNSSSMSSSYNRIMGSQGRDRVSGANVSITGAQAGPKFKSKLESALENRDVEEALNPALKFQRKIKEGKDRLEISQFNKALSNPSAAIGAYENTLRSQLGKGQSEGTIKENLQNYRKYLDYYNQVNRS